MSLRVLSVIQMCVVILLRWLYGNCDKLAEFNFGVAYMSVTIDLMDDAWSSIANDGSKMFDDDYMFGIFQPIIEKISPFEQYMKDMFEERTSYVVGGKTDIKKVLVTIFPEGVTSHTKSDTNGFLGYPEF